MRHIVQLTIMAFVAGLFAASQSLAGGGYEHGMSKGASSSQMEQTRQMEQTQQMEQTRLTEMAATSLNNSQVRELQKILNEKGFNAGAADGIIGPTTKQAIRDFQESEGLAATGNPDKETLQALSPDTKTQEFFGLSPEFGEKMMEKEQESTPEGTKMMEGY